MSLKEFIEGLIVLDGNIVGYTRAEMQRKTYVYDAEGSLLAKTYHQSSRIFDENDQQIGSIINENIFDESGICVATLQKAGKFFSHPNKNVAAAVYLLFGVERNKKI